MTVRYSKLAIRRENSLKTIKICIKTWKEQRNTLTEQRESCTIEHVVNNGVHATQMGMLPACCRRSVPCARHERLFASLFGRQHKRRKDNSKEVSAMIDTRDSSLFGTRNPMEGEVRIPSGCAIAGIFHKKGGQNRRRYHHPSDGTHARPLQRVGRRLRGVWYLS